MQVKKCRNHLIFLLLVTVLVGCSSIKLGYRFLDNAIRWKINDYVSLTAEQSSQVTRRINEFHRWHQSTQLATYADFMRRGVEQFERDSLGADDFRKMYDEAFDLMGVSLDKLIPVITDMLLSLDQSQIPQVIKNLERESANDLKSDFAITPAQRLAKRQNRMIQRLVKWTGPLNKDQMALIGTWAKDLPVDKEVRVSRQNALLNTLAEQLRNRSNPQQFKLRILQQVKTPEKFSNQNYTKSYNKRKQMTLQLMADLFNSLTPQQRATLIASTRKYQTDFQSLVPRQN